MNSHSKDYYNPNNSMIVEEFSSNKDSNEPEGKFDQFSKDWQKYMSDFVSQHVMVVPLTYKRQTEFFENVTQIPAKFRGAFIIDDNEYKDAKLSFKIISPSNKVLFEKTDYSGIFNVNLTERGLYRMLLVNNYVYRKEITPTITFNTGQNLILEKKQLTESEQKLNNLIDFLKNYYAEIKLTRDTRKNREKQLKKTNKYFFCFSLIETIVLIGVSVWQYYYLKHLFEIKGSL